VVLNRLDLYGDPIIEEEEPEEYKKTQLFDYLNDITNKKNNVFEGGDPQVEREYIPYVINRFLSQHIDCVFYANEMNTIPSCDKKLQFDYLINSIRKRFRRSSKWLKSEQSENIQNIKEYYGYSNAKAKVALSILTDEQLKYIKLKCYKGGLKK
tara:strand:+ start:6044 stop:6505 length:462 start_codon:yes stop_codon:yes gene_type:complete